MDSLTATMPVRHRQYMDSLFATVMTMALTVHLRDPIMPLPFQCFASYVRMPH